MILSFDTYIGDRLHSEFVLTFFLGFVILGGVVWAYKVDKTTYAFYPLLGLLLFTQYNQWKEVFKLQSLRDNFQITCGYTSTNFSITDRGYFVQYYIDVDSETYWEGAFIGTEKDNTKLYSSYPVYYDSTDPQNSWMTFDTSVFRCGKE